MSTTWRLMIGRHGGNIMFNGKWPMRGGRYPKPHPCHDDPRPTVMAECRRKEHGSDEWKDVPGEQPESDTTLGRFRARGYWASCFPEGDGITFTMLQEQSPEQVATDVAECFGVEVTR